VRDRSITKYYWVDEIKENMVMSGYLACVGKKKDAYSISMGKSEGKGHFEDLAIDGRIIFRC